LKNTSKCFPKELLISWAKKSYQFEHEIDIMLIWWPKVLVFFPHENNKNTVAYAIEEKDFFDRILNFAELLSNG